MERVGLAEGVLHALEELERLGVGGLSRGEASRADVELAEGMERVGLAEGVLHALVEL